MAAESGALSKAINNITEGWEVKTELDKEKAEKLIYFMQKHCARESWVEFCEDYAGMTTGEAKEFFSEVADKLMLDKQKFYFRG